MGGGGVQALFGAGRHCLWCLAIELQMHRGGTAAGRSIVTSPPSQGSSVVTVPRSKIPCTVSYSSHHPTHHPFHVTKTPSRDSDLGTLP